ncbi:MAG: phosphotriesterase family protein [Phenylobacterium sp.]
MASRRGLLAQVAAAGLASTAFAKLAAAAPVRPSAAGRTPGVVQTVLGPLEASKLGFTLPHEHVCASSGGFWQVWPEYFGGRAAFIDKAVGKLKAAKAGGVDTIVDLTTPDLGRDIRLLQEVSRRSGVHIVACTGIWHDPSLSFSARTHDELRDFFIKEIEQGIEGTPIRAGVIKVATDADGATPTLEKILRAAARASKATGTPIETHSYAPKRGGEAQADIFESEGLDPRTVSIGHSDDSLEMDYLTGLLKRGFMIGMDHMSQGIVEGAPPPEAAPYLWQRRSDRIKQLVDAGFANRMLLSNDWMLGLSVFATGTLETLDKLNPDGMLFNTRKVIPYLKQIGVTDAAIRLMTVENARRFFGGG